LAAYARADFEPMIIPYKLVILLTVGESIECTRQ